MNTYPNNLEHKLRSVAHYYLIMKTIFDNLPFHNTRSKTTGTEKSESSTSEIKHDDVGYTLTTGEGGCTSEKEMCWVLTSFVLSNIIYHIYFNAILETTSNESEIFELLTPFKKRKNVLGVDVLKFSPLVENERFYTRNSIHMNERMGECV